MEVGLEAAAEGEEDLEAEAAVTGGEVAGTEGGETEVMEEGEMIATAAEVGALGQLRRLQHIYGWGNVVITLARAPVSPCRLVLQPHRDWESAAPCHCRLCRL